MKVSGAGSAGLGNGFNDNGGGAVYMISKDGVTRCSDLYISGRSGPCA